MHVIDDVRKAAVDVTDLLGDIFAELMQWHVWTLHWQRDKYDQLILKLPNQKHTCHKTIQITHTKQTNIIIYFTQQVHVISIFVNSKKISCPIREAITKETMTMMENHHQQTFPVTFRETISALIIIGIHYNSKIRIYCKNRACAMLQSQQTY